MVIKKVCNIFGDVHDTIAVTGSVFLKDFVLRVLQILQGKVCLYRGHYTEGTWGGATYTFPRVA